MDMNEFKQTPALAEYLDGADHVDVKSGTGTLSLREFMAGVLSYQPGWMQVLWRIRVWLLRILGQGKSDATGKDRLTAETLPVETGQEALFFTVADSDGETYWVAIGEESHLGAALGVLVQPQDGQEGMKQFHLITVVRYRNWAGSIYFNLIRPFHYLIISAAMKSVLQTNKAVNH